jgi:hypothetical protein
MTARETLDARELLRDFQMHAPRPAAVNRFHPPAPAMQQIQEQAPPSTRFEVFDLTTGEIVTTRTTRKSAQRRADQLDLSYGCIHYGVREAH